MSRRGAIIVFSLMVLIVFIFGAPYIAPYDPLRTAPEIVAQPPSGTHVFGTDSLGRDVWSRFLYGGRATLLMVFGGWLIALVAGITMGMVRLALRGILGTAWDALINGIVAIPNLVFALAILSLMRPSPIAVIIAVGVMLTAPTARVLVEAMRAEQRRDYYAAGMLLGATPGYLRLHYALPNTLPTMVPYSAVLFGFALSNLALLTFLGFSGDPGVPEWGGMLYEGRLAFRAAPWIGAVPGVAITLLVFAINRWTRASTHFTDAK